MLGQDSELRDPAQAAIPKLLDFPRTTRSTARRVFGFSRTPTAAYHNNGPRPRASLALQLIADQTPADFDLSKDTLANRRTATPTAGPMTRCTPPGSASATRWPRR